MCSLRLRQNDTRILSKRLRQVQFLHQIVMFVRQHQSLHQPLRKILLKLLDWDKSRHHDPCLKWNPKRNILNPPRDKKQTKFSDQRQQSFNPRQSIFSWRTPSKWKIQYCCLSEFDLAQGLQWLFLLIHGQTFWDKGCKQIIDQTIAFYRFLEIVIIYDSRIFDRIFRTIVPTFLRPSQAALC